MTLNVIRQLFVYKDCTHFPHNIYYISCYYKIHLIYLKITDTLQYNKERALNQSFYLNYRLSTFLE